MMHSLKLHFILCFVSVVCSARNCSKDEFACKDGTCLPLSQVCNGQIDCSDQSDEKHCDYTLCKKPHWFKCNDNSTCIDENFVCDGRYNCPDGDDERECEKYHQPEHVPCEKDEFTCTDQVCIPIDLVCDGKPDCADNSDEVIGCTDIESRCHGFLCKNKHCLESEEWICDGHDDCGDGSDEIGCVNNCKLEDDVFACNDTCIPLAKVCNGADDCSDGRDEGALCGSKTNNCARLKCPGKCKQLPKGPQCICPKGFAYNELKNTCDDVDECKIYGICSHGCVNTVGSYKCTCADKFKLKSDGRSCAVEYGEPFLLYTTQHSVVGLYLKSKHLYYVAKNLSQAIGVTYDGNYVYWTDITLQEESIVRAREDGTNQEVIMRQGIEAPEDIAVDWLTGNIYFSDNFYSHIAVCSNNGYYCTALIKENVDKPRGITLHPKMGIMFWTDWGRIPMIGKASMDGNSLHKLVTKNIHWPNGLSLDIPNRRLYWVDGKSGTIESVRLDGSDRRIVLSKILKHPYGITVFEDRIYWSDWKTRSIHTCNKFTGKHHKIVARDRSIFAVHIYHSALRQRGNHTCENNKCSHLCLLSANTSYSCACPQGMELGVDQSTCKDLAKKRTLYVGVANYLLQFKHTSFGRHETGNGTALPLYISKMEYNTKTGSLFVADNMQRQIYEVDTTSYHIKLLVKNQIGNISALAYDILSDNLYWTDSLRHTVEIFSLKTKMRAIVHHFSGSDVPIALCLVPSKGKMFIALKSHEHTHVDMQSMHGRGTHSHLFEDQLGTGALQLVADDATETVFIVDSQGRKIEFTNFDGSSRTLFRDDLKYPVSMALLDVDLAWSVKNSHLIYWTHRSNMGTIKKFEITKPPNINFPEEIIMASSKPRPVVDHPCLKNNGECSHICVSTGKFSSACLCPAGMVFKDYTNITCIEALDCEFRCRSGECLTSSRKCNGHKDCADGSDEKGCTMDKSKKKSKKICAPFEFACHNGLECIPQEMRCDKNYNCDDKSDEEHCENFVHISKCHKYQYACPSGECVDITAFCDGIKDCADGSDEKICEDLDMNLDTCGEKMFRCIPGQCIPIEWECDGHLDCSDGSDEHSKCPPRQCPENFMMCPLGHCIDKKLVCDGHDDCGDGTDERNCDRNHPKIVCGDTDDENGHPSMFQCPSELTKCLPISAVCNGTAECSRGEDEAFCDSCSIHEFECKKSKKCIRIEFQCDNEKDCDDGSDEVNCTMHRNSSLAHHFYTRTCHDDMFHCNDGTCIDRMRVCDGTIDCRTGEDESAKCKSACENHPCEQKCTPSPYGPVCDCSEGYKLKTDKKTCMDVDECAEFKPCAQLCRNTHGSYRCSCYPDFMLHIDKTTCKSISREHYLLFTTSNQVRKLSDNPVAMEVVWTVNDSMITGIDVNAREKMVYFAIQDSFSIFRRNLETGEVLQIPDVGNPTKLAVDWITNNIYYINLVGSYSIKVCHFHDKISPCIKLIKHRPKDIIKALAVDPINKLLFYSVMHFSAFGPIESVIYKTYLDGTHQQILQPVARYVTAMDCDVYKKTLYYIEYATRSIHSISYSGKETEVVIKHDRFIDSPTGLSVYENHAFIVNRGIPEAVKCKLYGDKSCHAFNINVYNAEDIVLVGISKQKNVTNVCESHKCALLCVHGDMGPKCLCNGGSYVQPGAECEYSSPDEGHRETNIHSGSFTNKQRSSASNIAMAVCFTLLALIGVGLLGYLWIRRRHGHGKFNIHMHFQNPLSRANPNAGNSEQSGPVKMSQLCNESSPANTSSCTKCPGRKLQFGNIRFFGSSGQTPLIEEDARSQASSNHEIEKDPKAPLVL